MVCGSCGKPTDPNRSFCQNCGSSVFVEDARRSPMATAAAVRTEARTEAAKTVRQSRARQAGPSSRTITPGAGCLGSLIRLVIFIGVGWWAWGYIDRFPEVRAVKAAYQRGDIVDLDTFVRAVQAAANGEDAPPAPPRGRSAVPVESPAEPASVPAPATQAARTPGPAVGSSVPARGVYLAGNGVTAPRPVRQVRPAYTPSARAARIEGVVMLNAVVQTDGSVTDIAVIQSLDDAHGLDDEAVKALSQWRFEPGERAGQPVPVQIKIALAFNLSAPTR